MFVASGVGPYSGQSVHFRLYAPEKNEYAQNRYAFEAQRHFGILDARLAKHKYVLGDTYTIVDMATWGWARLIPTVLGEAAWAKFPESQASGRRDHARPAAQRAVALRDKFKFKAEMDDWRAGRCIGTSRRRSSDLLSLVQNIPIRSLAI